MLLPLLRLRCCSKGASAEDPHTARHTHTARRTRGGARLRLRLNARSSSRGRGSSCAGERASVCVRPRALRPRDARRRLRRRVADVAQRAAGRGVACGGGASAQRHKTSRAAPLRFSKTERERAWRVRALPPALRACPRARPPAPARRRGRCRAAPSAPRRSTCGARQRRRQCVRQLRSQRLRREAAARGWAAEARRAARARLPRVPPPVRPPRRAPAPPAPPRRSAAAVHAGRRTRT
jgi:hypothetical protein